MASGSLEHDEWDADFLEELVQFEERHLATQSSRYAPPRRPTVPISNSPPRQPTVPISHSPPRQPTVHISFSPPRQPTVPISYSPPRELSQRTRETSHAIGIVDGFDSFAPSRSHFAKEQEIDILKKELGRVSNQLNVLEQECSDLRKERDQKEEQLKVVHSRVEEKVAEKYHEKSKNSNHFAPTSTDPGTSRACPDANPPNNPLGPWTKSCNSVGVQTDKVTELRSFRGPEKLLDVWNSSNGKQGKILVEKLLTTCGADIWVLFGYMNSGIPYKAKVSFSKNNSDMALSDQQNAAKLIETEKVSVFYSEWTKISNEASRFEDLLESLVHLSSLKNVVIVHSSLRILHMVLMNSFSMGKNFGKRENVTVEEPLSGNDESEINGCGYSGNETLFFANVRHILNQGNSSSGLRLLNNKTPGHGGFFNHDRFAESISGAHWVSLFERICQIAITNNDEKIRVEALSIMNLILTSQNAYLERHRFVWEQLFQSLAKLLRKDAGFCVQDLAVHTLYLLCNCPKVVSMLCSGIKEDAADPASSNDMNEKTSLQTLDEILIGLADCVACSGTASAEEMKLRRNAVLFLAFLASSGKSGFEILLNHSLSKGNNFLCIIVQSLISDMELEVTKPAQLSDIVREQNWLIRDALILLNRLVSNQKYSIPVLQALTSTRDMASMTVDLANRLTCKSSKVVSWQQDSNQIAKQILESEVMDLARVFKKRVFTYLGDGKSSLTTDL